EDDEDAVGAHGAGFRDLPRVVEEVLAQDRKGGRRARFPQVVGRALEGGGVGEDREAGGTSRLVGPGMGSGVEIRADESLRGTRLLHLCDEAVAAAGSIDQRTGEGTDCRCRARLGLDRGKRAFGLAAGDLLELVGLYAVEDGHVSAVLVRVARASALVRAAPESMLSAA